MIKKNRGVEILQFVHVQRRHLMAQCAQAPAQINGPIKQVVSRRASLIREHAVGIEGLVEIPKSKVHGVQTRKTGLMRQFLNRKGGGADHTLPR
jgi:hypothetical protein